jgi:hypothetical protein
MLSLFEHKEMGLMFDWREASVTIRWSCVYNGVTVKEFTQECQ